MQRVSPFLLGIVVLLGCQDHTSPVSPIDTGRSSVINHAGTGGNENFFWLPPLAPKETFSGPANLALSPEIRVCTAPADLSKEVAACERTAAVAWFTKTISSPAGSLITVVDEHYQVDWDTKATVDLTLGATYRVFALIGGTGIGYLDVYLAANGQEASAANGDVFGLVDNRSLPIRFRLQHGVLLEGGCELDCAEFTATNDAFEECTTNDWACLSASQDWLPDGFEEVTIVIDRITPAAAGGPCFASIPLPQGEGCYTVTTHPSLDGAPFNEQSQVLWHMCQADNLPGDYEIHQETDNGEIRRPAVVVVPDPLDCEGFSGVASSAIPDFLRRLAGPVRQFLFGTPVYAADSFSAQILSFSRFFYARTLDLVSTFTPVGPFAGGTTLPLQYQVLATHGHANGLPVSGIEVAFSGGVSTLFDVSDGLGMVNAGVVLGATEMTYELVASAGAVADTVAATVVPTVNVAVASCPASTGSGDQISRGFYLPSYGAMNLTRVDLYFTASEADSYTLRLTARESSFDGRLIGEATATTNLATASMTQTTFAFDSKPYVTSGSTVTFAISKVSGPAATIFYDVNADAFELGGPDSPTDGCAVIETEGTSAPLDQFRRGGVAVSIFGDAVIIN